MAFTTFGQETEWAYSYRSRTGTEPTRGGFKGPILLREGRERLGNGRVGAWEGENSGGRKMRGEGR